MDEATATRLRDFFRVTAGLTDQVAFTVVESLRAGRFRVVDPDRDEVEDRAAAAGAAAEVLFQHAGKPLADDLTYTPSVYDVVTLADWLATGRLFAQEGSDG